MKTYDAIIVLGRGIYKDGSIPQSAQATVRKAVGLHKSGVAPYVIFSGKWTYTIDYIPPKTEARAMADYAIELGLPKSAIILEEDSNTTVANCYFIKTKVLQPRDLKNVLLVSVPIFDERACYVLQFMLGVGYNFDAVTADFEFPIEKQDELKDLEAKKLKRAKEFYKDFAHGDHETIYRAAVKELKEVYMKEKL